MGKSDFFEGGDDADRELDREIEEAEERDRPARKETGTPNAPSANEATPTTTAVTKVEEPEKQDQEKKGKGDSLLPVEIMSIGNLPADLQKSMLLRKQSVQLTEYEAGKRAGVVAYMGAKTWGAVLDQPTRIALARWADRFGIDVASEIDVLGTAAKPEIYLRGIYYLRRLADLVSSGMVEYAYADHVEEDDRLTTKLEDLTADQQKEFRDEAARRRFQRVTHRLPDEATGAVVFRVKLKNMAREVVGTAYCGGNTKKKIGSGGIVKQGNEVDPIGSVEPAKTAETRAARRCMRQLVKHVPVLQSRLVQIESETGEITGQIAESRQEFERLNPPERIKAVADGGYDG